jgi:preprotein translocase subunit SecD
VGRIGYFGVAKKRSDEMKTIPLLLLVALLTACTTAYSPKNPVTIEFREGSQSQAAGFVEMTVRGSEVPVYIAQEALLSHRDVERAEVSIRGGGPRVNIAFTEEGGERFAQVTEQLKGKLLGVLVDGELISATRVMEGITGGMTVITGDFSKEEARRIAAGITLK